MPLRPALRDFAGELLLPGDPAFDDARRTQNDAIDRRPALPIRVRGGGHVWARLQAIRSFWDPDDVFAGGHAITLAEPPSVSR